MTLKSNQEALGIGVGAKDWKTVKEICNAVELDWVMFANSLTVWQQPAELINFIRELSRKGVWVINSAVFQSGFLLGGPYFDYKEVDPSSEQGAKLCAWRGQFHKLCDDHKITPLEACVQFSLTVPGVDSIALQTSRREHIGSLVAATKCSVPNQFWHEMREAGLMTHILA